MIEIKNLTKSYDKKCILKNINLKINDNEQVSIIGKSGCGKSTLLRCIARLEKIDKGQILIDNENVNNIKKFYNKVGMVFQSFNLFENMTVLENVELATQLCKNSLDPSDILDKVGLKNRKNNFPAQLSGGEQQRVAIARAICKNPKLLLCDEPTGALDYKTGKQILKLLQDTCRNEQMTVIIITHNSAISPMADKVIKFKNGTVSDVIINDKPKNIEDIEW